MDDGFMVQKIKQRRSIDLHIHIIQTILKYKCKNPKVKIDINMEKYNVSTNAKDKSNSVNYGHSSRWLCVNELMWLRHLSTLANFVKSTVVSSL